MALQIEVAQARCLSRCFCSQSEVEAQCWKPSTVADWRGIYLEVYLEKKVGGASWLFVARSEAKLSCQAKRRKLRCCCRRLSARAVCLGQSRGRQEA